MKSLSGGSSPRPERRIGLLGGTFDPPHYGHLWLAESARDQLQLDEVRFLPVGQPVHKQDRPVTAVEHRLAMTRHAIADNPTCVLDTRDSDRPPPHTTATLLPQLIRALGPARFWLLIGADSLCDITTWSEPDALIRLCRLAVLPRPGAAPDWIALETAVPGISRAVDMLRGPALSHSSSELRAWAAAGHSLQYLVPPAVWRYIQQHNLY